MLPLPLSELFISWMYRSLFSNEYLFYDDNRWWTSRYQPFLVRMILMIFVSIDIAKFNHFATAMSSDGKILIEPFIFLNDADGFQILVSKLNSLNRDDIIIGLESTAHYGYILVRFLVATSYGVYILNPLQAFNMRKNNIRKTKPDKIDSCIIYKTLMLQNNPRLVSFYDLDMLNLKT